MRGFQLVTSSRHILMWRNHGFTVRVRFRPKDTSVVFRLSSFENFDRRRRTVRVLRLRWSLWKQSPVGRMHCIYVVCDKRSLSVGDASRDIRKTTTLWLPRKHACKRRSSNNASHQPQRTSNILCLSAGNTSSSAVAQLQQYKTSSSLFYSFIVSYVGYRFITACMRCSVVFGVTSRLLVINISSSSPTINTAAYCQRCVITCETVRRWPSSTGDPVDNT